MRRNRGLVVDFSAVHGRRLLIALSGGADSTALAALLAEARDALCLDLRAAHLDHGIRPESAGDAEWCRALCEGLRIPYHSARLDVPGEAARTGEGLETAARRLRYAWLRQVKAEVGADYIALAHHMDDQAETVLMHLARGAGPEGIPGMAEFSGDLYRPLLGVRRDALRRYLTDRRMDWLEDGTNAVADTPRNALRLHGIPALEQSYPQVVPAIARYAAAARIESDYLALQAERYIAAGLVALPGGYWLDLAGPPHPAVLRRAIRALSGPGLTHERLNAAAGLSGAPRGRAELNDGWRAERGMRGLYILRDLPPAPEAPLRPDGESALGGLCTVVAAPSPASPARDDPMRQVLRRDALGGAVLRTRRPGDRIRPLGCGEKLLSDYLTDRKVDRPLRDRLALVARGSRVLWVCGIGIAEDAKLLGPGDDAICLLCRYPFDMLRLVK